MKKPDKNSPEGELLKAFEAAGLVEYLQYLQSGKRIMLTNFKAGVAKGLGLTLGMSVVLGVIAWILTLMVDLPVIGQYANDVVNYMNEYRESTNYTDEFQVMNELLQNIDENTSPSEDKGYRVDSAIEPKEISGEEDPGDGNSSEIPVSKDS